MKALDVAFQITSHFNHVAYGFRDNIHALKFMNPLDKLFAA